MSYEPTVWKDGDLVTSAKLNKLEQGVANGGGVLVAHVDENGKLDKTWQEIYDADLAVISVIENGHKNVWPIEVIYSEDNIYGIQYANGDLSTTAPDDYPAFGEDAGGNGK